MNVPTFFRRKKEPEKPTEQDEQAQNPPTDTLFPDYLLFDEDAQEVLFRDNRFPDETFPYAKHFSDDRDPWEMKQLTDSGLKGDRCQNDDASSVSHARRDTLSHDDVVVPIETACASTDQEEGNGARDLPRRDIFAQGTSDCLYWRYPWFCRFYTETNVAKGDIASASGLSTTSLLPFSGMGHVAPRLDARMYDEPYFLRDVMWIEPDWVFRKTQVEPKIEPRAHMYFGMLITVIFLYPRIVFGHLPNGVQLSDPARRQWWWLRTILGLLLAARLYLCGIPQGL